MKTLFVLPQIKIEGCVSSKKKEKDKENDFSEFEVIASFNNVYSTANLFFFPKQKFSALPKTRQCFIAVRRPSLRVTPKYRGWQVLSVPPYNHHQISTAPPPKKRNEKGSKIR